MIEVLAPAGSPESVVAAVRAGADAVYFGASSFNARRNAKNFTEEDMASVCEYCRVRGIKTYLTLNTLVNDRERIDALQAAYTAVEKGVDALIVQDIGLAALLRKNLPEVPLHASTQLSVHSAEGLYALKEMGFKRVVPAREMDRESLKRLCLTAKELGIEVEVFIHGALCMCLSGQCYLSSVLGGRSGNRGLCAQPCRLPFEVKNGTGHDLSLKDMSYINHIGELADIGVCSFKIEGRMKRPEYVAAATAAARAVSDGEKVPDDVVLALSGVFSRSGHTDGYFTAKTGREMFGIRTENDENLSKAVLTSTHNLYRLERQRVAINGELTVIEGQPISLTVTDGKHTATEQGAIPQKAINVAATEESLKQKVEKLGGTCYYFEKLNVNLGQGLAVAGKELGILRQNAIKKLDSLRADNSVDIGEFRTEGLVLSNRQNCSKPLKIVAQFRSAEQIPEDISGISAVILPAETDFSKVQVGLPLIADVPRGVMHNGSKVIEQLKSAKKNGVKAAMVNNVAAFYFAKEAGLSAIAGFGMNIFNSNSVDEAARLGAVASVLSFESAMKDAVNMGGQIPKGIISYGRLPLMIFKNCPGKNGDGCKTCGGMCTLTDRLGVEFPVMCRNEFSEMFNSRPLWLLDRQNEMNGLDFQVLMFTDEAKEQAGEIIKSAVKGDKPRAEYTRGLYYREVM